MAFSKPAAILLATGAFLGAAPAAQAAGANLSTQPPSSVPPGAQASGTTTSAAQTAQPGATLPRTGVDLAAEALVAALLLAGGLAVRTGSAVRPE